MEIKLNKRAWAGDMQGKEYPKNFKKKTNFIYLFIYFPSWSVNEDKHLIAQSFTCKIPNNTNL